MAETRSGADYLHFEGLYCPEDEGGCGVMLRLEDVEAETIADAAQEPCSNCEHRPVAHVSVTTADRIAGG